MWMPHERLGYSWCYVVEDRHDDLHVIDPGWPADENWETVDAFARSIGSSLDRVASVTATHLHPDHIGLAARMRSYSGAQVLMHALEDDALALHTRDESRYEVAERFEAWGVPEDRRAEMTVRRWGSEAHADLAADVRLQHGDVLPIAGHGLRVVHTPGHTAGHICLVDEADGLVLTGDHVLPTRHAGVGLGGATHDNPLAQYLESLERVAILDDYEAAPGHEFVFRGLADRCSATARHHLRRTAEAAAVMSGVERPSIWEIASRLTWTAGWEGLGGTSLASALNQTRMHVEFVSSGSAQRYLDVYGM